MAPAPKKPSALQTALTLAKFGAHGLSLPFRDNPSLPAQANEKGKTGFEGYSPIAPDLLPSTIYGLVNMLPGAPAKTHLPAAISNYLDAAQVRVQAADDRGRAQIGIGEPTNAWELGAEVLGSWLIPGAPVRNAPKVVQALTGTAKAAQAAKAVGRGVAEMAVPFRQGKLASKTTAAIAALPVAATEAADAIKNSPEYKGIPEYLGKQEGIADDPNDQFEYTPLGDTEDDQFEYTALGAEDDDQFEYESLETPEPSWKQHPLLTAGAILGSIGLGYTGLRTIQNLNKARLASSTALTGQKSNDQFTSSATLLKGGILRADQALVDSYLAPDKKLFVSLADGVTASSINNKAKSALRTGEVHNSGVTFTPTAPMLEAYAKEVDEIGQTIVGDALIARTVLDDIDAGRPRSALEFEKDGKTPLTEEKLRKIAELGENDPAYAPWIKEMRAQESAILDYKVSKGMISAEDAAKARKDRPNYMHLSRNETTKTSALKTLFGIEQHGVGMDGALNRFASRADKAGAGVKTGAVIDPVREIPNRWHTAIREAEINDIKKMWLNAAENTPELAKFVTKMPKQPDDLSRTVGVMVNGKQEYYHIKDDAILNALKYAPQSAHTGLTVLLSVPKKIKKISQAFKTGNLAPNFAPVGAMYDFATSTINAERGLNKGLINEGLGYLGAKPIGRLDITSGIADLVVGPLRLGADRIIEQVSKNISTEMFRGNGALAGLIGEQAAKVIEDVLSRLQLASVHLEMEKAAGALAKKIQEINANSALTKAEKVGLLGTNQFGGFDPSKLSTGIAELAPTFYTQQAARAYADAVQGNTTVAQQILEASILGYEKGKANQLANMYKSILQTIRDGPKYSTFLTNMPVYERQAMGLERLSSMIKRASGDAGQIGNSQLYRELNEVALYINPAIQPLAQTARRLWTAPTHTVANMAMLAAQLIAVRYGVAALSPENADKIRNMSDAEKTSKVPFFGEMEIPIEPLQRAWMAPIFAVLDEVSGLNAGQFNPNFIQVIESMLDGDETTGAMSEQGEHSLSEQWRLAWQGVSPLHPSAIPGANILMQSQGFNPGMTRYTGSPELIQAQTVDPLGGDGTLTDDALNSTWQAVISEVTSASIAGFVRSALDWGRAISGGVDDGKAVEVALSRIGQTVANKGSVLNPLFPDAIEEQKFNTPDVSLWFKKLEGMERFEEIYNKDIRNAYVTGQNPRFAQARDVDTVLPEYQRTALLPIGAITAELNKTLEKELRPRLSTINKQIADVKNQRGSTIPERVEKLNAYNEERKEIIEKMTLITRQFEEHIRMATGITDFTYQNANPEKYKIIPYPPMLQNDLAE